MLIRWKCEKGYTKYTSHSVVIKRYHYLHWRYQKVISSIKHQIISQKQFRISLCNCCSMLQAINATFNHLFLVSLHKASQTIIIKLYFCCLTSWPNDFHSLITLITIISQQKRQLAHRLNYFASFLITRKLNQIHVKSTVILYCNSIVD